MISSMEQVDFAFSLALLNHLTSALITISANLQNPKIDLIECCREVAYLRFRLQESQESNTVFERVYNSGMMSKSI